MYTNAYSNILTIDEVMEILKIGRNQCYELLNSKRLKGFRTGSKTWKIPYESVEEFINNQISNRS